MSLTVLTVEPNMYIVNSNNREEFKTRLTPVIPFHSKLIVMDFGFYKSVPVCI